MIALLLALLSCFGGEELDALRVQAQTLEQRGELREAAAVWMRVFGELTPGEEREALGERMSALEHRLQLRRELIESCSRQPALFAGVGLSALDEQGGVLEEKRLRWQELPLDRIAKAFTQAKLSRSAWHGLIHERLVRGNVRERAQSFSDLAECLERGELGKAEVWATLARARGEPLPKAGYVYVQGRWQAASDLPPPPPPAGDAALQAFQRAQQPLLEKAFLDPLLALDQQYLALERLRSEALGLIFDEEKYFYPFQPPECPPEKARLFPAVQQEVDRRVTEVRRAWKSSRRVKPPAAARAALRELQQLQADPSLAKLALDGRLPECVRWLDPEAAEWTLSNFARNAAEAHQRAQDRQVAEHNARLSGDLKPLIGNEEREQLRITNEYRQMLGRHLLAWNPKLQLAAREHSRWMSTTGKFGHFQDDPALRTPFDRMKAQGYLQGAGENVHMGDSGPEGAHVGWTHSSGHHRQILSPTSREFAAGLSGPYWTQNYGGGTEYLQPR